MSKLKINDVDGVLWDCLNEILCDLEQHGKLKELKNFCEEENIDFEDCIKYFNTYYA